MIVTAEFLLDVSQLPKAGTITLIQPPRFIGGGGVDPDGPKGFVGDDQGDPVALDLPDHLRVVQSPEGNLIMVDGPG